LTGLAKANKLRYITLEVLPLREAMLALTMALGVLGGFVCSRRCCADTAEELRRYLTEYCALRPEASGAAAAETLICYLRAPLAAFLLGFSPLGVALLPLLSAVQGFVLSFSLFSFAAALGRDGFAALAALFGLRLAVVVPCTLCLAAAALEKAHALALLTLGGKRQRPVVYGAAYRDRFAVCCALLLLAAAAELWLVPRLPAPLIL